MNFKGKDGFICSIQKLVFVEDFDGREWAAVVKNGLTQQNAAAEKAMYDV